MCGISVSGFPRHPCISDRQISAFSWSGLVTSNPIPSHHVCCLLAISLHYIWFFMVSFEKKKTARASKVSFFPDSYPFCTAHNISASFPPQVPKSTWHSGHIGRWSGPEGIGMDGLGKWIDCLHCRYRRIVSCGNSLSIEKEIGVCSRSSGHIPLTHTPCPQTSLLDMNGSHTWIEGRIILRNEHPIFCAVHPAQYRSPSCLLACWTFCPLSISLSSVAGPF